MTSVYTTSVASGANAGSVRFVNPQKKTAEAVFLFFWINLNLTLKIKQELC